MHGKTWWQYRVCYTPSNPDHLFVPCILSPHFPHSNHTSVWWHSTWLPLQHALNRPPPARLAEKQLQKKSRSNKITKYSKGNTINLKDPKKSPKIPIYKSHKVNIQDFLKVPQNQIENHSSDSEIILGTPDIPIKSPKIPKIQKNPQNRNRTNKSTGWINKTSLKVAEEERWRITWRVSTRYLMQLMDPE